jgi:FAD/FMN-containing dehydrogenase
MRRTTLLFIAAQLLNPVTADGSAFTCQPEQSCWPTTAEWQAFNQTVSGALHVTVPLGSVCFPSSPNFDSGLCATVQENYMNGTFRELSSGALEDTTWESCGTANCFPGVFAPQGQTCSLGRLSALQVYAKTSEDITSTIAFVRKHGIRMVIKNTGHDYHGRSSAANSLTLNTHNLKNISFESSFTAQNCPSAGTRQNIAIIGAGVVAQEAVDYFDERNFMVTIGGCHSVGIAGGYGQAAGHGLLAPAYGLMVDQAVEFDVITPDGVFRTINECNDPDLFWAMRGGGGSSYAVLVNYKFRVYPSTKWAAWRVALSFNNSDPDLTKSSALHDILTELSNEQPNWSANKASGYDTAAATSMNFLEVMPIGQDPLGTLKNLTSKFNSFLTSYPGLNITINSYLLYDSQKAFYAAQEDYLTQFGTVGISVLTPSRLITTDNFETPAKVDALVTGVLQGMENARQQLINDTTGAVVDFLILKSGASNTADPQNATSSNPVWRETLWHLVSAAGWLPGMPDGDVAATAARAAIEAIKAPLAVQAAYLNESDPDEPDWEDVFFGGNYDKLLAIKQKYDPDMLLNCRKCVGYLGDADPMYSCYSDSPVASKAYPFA